MSGTSGAETPVGGCIVLSVPLPPPSLRANSRAHWSRKKKDADEYSEAVLDAAFGSKFVMVQGTLKRAHVLYTWRYCGVAPDHGNLGGHTKYLQDILAVAPKLGLKQAEKYKRWHLGIVENDRGITAAYEMERVAHRTETGVLVTITEIKGDG